MTLPRRAARRCDTLTPPDPVNDIPLICLYPRKRCFPYCRGDQSSVALVGEPPCLSVLSPRLAMPIPLTLVWPWVLFNLCLDARMAANQFRSRTRVPEVPVWTESAPVRHRVRIAQSISLIHNIPLIGQDRAGPCRFEQLAQWLDRSPRLNATFSACRRSCASNFA